jgi:hypothetical protein
MITTTEESNARKEKGKTLQMDVAAKLRAAFPQYAEDIESTPMSAHGEDINEPPHLNWSTAMFRKRRTENGEQATEAGRDCLEVTAS